MPDQKPGKLLEDTHSVVDEIFKIFESVKDMFKQWDRSKHTLFIQEVMRLQALEEKLCQLGYEEEFVRLLVKCVYESVFSEYERAHYSGNRNLSLRE